MINGQEEKRDRRWKKERARERYKEKRDKQWGRDRSREREISTKSVRQIGNKRKGAKEREENKTAWKSCAQPRHNDLVFSPSDDGCGKHMCLMNELKKSAEYNTNDAVMNKRNNQQRQPIIWLFWPSILLYNHEKYFLNGALFLYILFSSLFGWTIPLFFSSCAWCSTHVDLPNTIWYDI